MRYCIEQANSFALIEVQWNELEITFLIYVENGVGARVRAHYCLLPPNSLVYLFIHRLNVLTLNYGKWCIANEWSSRQYVPCQWSMMNDNDISDTHPSRVGSAQTLFPQFLRNCSSCCWPLEDVLWRQNKLMEDCPRFIYYKQSFLVDLIVSGRINVSQINYQVIWWVYFMS